MEQVAKDSTEGSHSKKPYMSIGEHFSKEIVIAYCGAIGAGVKEVNDSVEEIITRIHGYTVKPINISNLITHYSDLQVDESSTYNRYKTLQDAGNSLREDKGKHILAELAVGHISLLRQKMDVKSTECKTAYIIHQIKNPHEIDFFRLVYEKDFYLIGVIRSEDGRDLNLKQNGVENRTKRAFLIERDKSEKDDNGQKIVQCIHRSDFIINNDEGSDQVKNEVERFFALVHGANTITPTKDEIGMHEAYSSSLSSSCLSRQVGAAILDESGGIMAHGYNDAPKYRGGLYPSIDKDNREDFRCFNYGSIWIPRG